VLFGALDSKDHVEMLTALMPLTDRFVLASPRVVGKRGIAPDGLVEVLEVLRFQGDVAAIEQPEAALATALEQSGPDDAIVVTGSMYLVGNIREHWYETRDIVIQRTPWPGERGGKAERRRGGTGFPE
jgi:dihydrofolate synthase/folylpolyglutamate synthase